jgi:hypothetical protein
MTILEILNATLVDKQIKLHLFEFKITTINQIQYRVWFDMTDEVLKSDKRCKYIGLVDGIITEVSGYSDKYEGDLIYFNTKVITPGGAYNSEHRISVCVDDSFELIRI